MSTWQVIDYEGEPVSNTLAPTKSAAIDAYVAANGMTRGAWIAHRIQTGMQAVRVPPSNS